MSINRLSKIIKGKIHCNFFFLLMILLIDFCFQIDIQFAVMMYLTCWMDFVLVKFWFLLSLIQRYFRFYVSLSILLKIKLYMHSMLYFLSWKFIWMKNNKRYMSKYCFVFIQCFAGLLNQSFERKTLLHIWLLGDV